MPPSSILVGAAGFVGSHFGRLLRHNAIDALIAGVKMARTNRAMQRDRR